MARLFSVRHVENVPAWSRKQLLIEFHRQKQKDTFKKNKDKSSALSTGCRRVKTLTLSQLLSRFKQLSSIGRFEQARSRLSTTLTPPPGGAAQGSKVAPQPPSMGLFIWLAKTKLAAAFHFFFCLIFKSDTFTRAK